jgi:hypothetical protein
MAFPERFKSLNSIGCVYFMYRGMPKNRGKMLQRHIVRFKRVASRTFFNLDLGHSSATA